MPKKKGKQIKIYLAGRIPIGNESGVDPLWRKKYIRQLERLAPRAIIFDPTHRDINEEDAKAVFGHDLFLIKQADLILANAETRVGLGTAQEMIIAKYFQKPIVVVSPKDSYYSPTKTSINGKKVKKWHHPFLAAISDWIIEDIEELEPVLEGKLKRKKVIPWKTFIEKTIGYYLKQCFPKDKKTKEMLKK